MIGGVARWREQGEHQVHRFVVYRRIVDGGLQPHEDPPDPIDTLDKRVWNRDTMTDAGRRHCFTLHQCVEHHAGLEPMHAGGDFAHHGKNLPLVGGSHPRTYCPWG